MPANNSLEVDDKLARTACLRDCGHLALPDSLTISACDDGGLLGRAHQAAIQQGWIAWQNVDY
jgi:hypothetical protein